MTRKDYQLIAEGISNHRRFATEANQKVTHDVLDSLSSRLAEMFAQDNERFDREKFRKACGVRF